MSFMFVSQFTSTPGSHHSAHEASMSTSPDADGASGAFLKKTGWLKKKSPGGFLGIAIWQSRYVVVDEESETLKYFRTMEDADAGKAGQFILLLRVELNCIWSQLLLYFAAGELSFNEIVRVKGDPANSNFEIQVCARSCQCILSGCISSLFYSTADQQRIAHLLFRLF